MGVTFTFDRKQLVFSLSVAVVLVLVGVLFVIFGPSFSVRPFSSPIVTRAVGVLALVGGVHEFFLTWPIVSRWDRPPVAIDSSGMTLLAVRRPPVRIEWEEVASIDPAKDGAAISLVEGEVVTLDLDLIRVDGRRPWPRQVAELLAAEWNGHGCRSDMRDLTFLPEELQRSAMRVRASSWEVMWPIEDAEAAINALAAAGRVIYGLDLRSDGPGAEGHLPTEVPWSDFESTDPATDVEGRRLAAIEHLRRPMVTELASAGYYWVLITWSGD